MLDSVSVMPVFIIENFISYIYKIKVLSSKAMKKPFAKLIN